MNEKIKALAEQASFRLGQSTAANNAHLDQQLEEFAKLIVQECSAECQQIAFKHAQVDGSYAAGKKAGAFECEARLRDYFGIR